MPNKNKRSAALLILCLLIFFSAVSCQTENKAGEAERDTPDTPAQEDALAAEKIDAKSGETKKGGKEVQPGNKKDGESGGGKGGEAGPAQTHEMPPLLQEPRPNELGEIMILMYHEIGSPEGEWRRTPQNFRRDLEVLYEQGYRAVSLSALVRGNIDIPAGTSPVVLTFDDGNRGNFNYLQVNGELQMDPDCAVAIMESFHAENPDFGLAATFFIYYPNPFRQPAYIEKKLNYLLEQRFAIGNHTLSHANLGSLGAEDIRRELALHVKTTREYIPGYEVASLSLPYGAYPQENAELVVEGLYAGVSYRHEAVLLVGANPAPSPFHTNFNAYKLPRIRASEMKTEGVGLYDWLAYFQQNPHKRYISDGEGRYVSAPQSMRAFLKESALDAKEIRFYED